MLLLAVIPHKDHASQVIHYRSTFNVSSLVISMATQIVSQKAYKRKLIYATILCWSGRVISVHLVSSRSFGVNLKSHYTKT